MLIQCKYRLIHTQGKKMKYLSYEDENNLRYAIKSHESLCNARKGGTPESISYMNQIKEILETNGLEFCDHNAAFYGYEKYQKYKIKGMDYPLTIEKYKELQEFDNFIKLQKENV